MGIFDKLTGKIAKTKKSKAKPTEGKARTNIKQPNTEVKKPKAPPAPKINSDKERATKKGEPYVAVLSMDLDPANPGNGAFELDWNDKFVANLVRAGYQKRPNEPDSVIVDRWFQDVCRNVVLETYEQEQADPANRTNRRDLGDGRTEIS